LLLKENNLNEITRLNKDIKTTNQQDLKITNQFSKIKDFQLLLILNKFVFYIFFLFIFIIHILCLLVFPYFVKDPIEIK